MIDLAQSSIEPAIMIENRVRAINIKRCPEFLSDLLQVGSPTTKSAVAVVKGMHCASV
jgi:hypothetical protein